MIPKVHQHGSIHGLGSLLRYLFGPGENNARGGIHHDPHVIAAWAYATGGNLADLQPPRMGGRYSLRRLTELLAQPVRAGANPPGLPVWHCSVHNHPDDPVLSDRQWEHAATALVAATGLAPHGDLSAVRWIGIRHDTRHVHIVATLVRQDRRTAWLHHDYPKAQSACREVEKRYGLRRVGIHRAAARPPTPAELNKATRQHRGQVPRHRLRQLVRVAAEAANGEPDFLDQLRTVGLLVRPRADPTDPNQLTGYAVALPGDHNAAGHTIWYSGSSLAASLTLPQLRGLWRSA